MDAQQVQKLMTPQAFAHAVDDLQLIETHISWVVLAGPFAYKIKKPIRNSFLDYSSLEARRGYCQAELRLNRRFAPELYLDVVAINSHQGQLAIEGPGQTIESAVRMQRFPSDALMSARLAAGQVDTQHVRALAARVARFHAEADRASSTSRFGSPDEVYQEALDNIRDLVQSMTAAALGSELESQLLQVDQWTKAYFAAHREFFAARKQAGHVRECHGDLHLGNIVWWQAEFIPFDGIEFSEEFRWIDTLSDAAFTAMDLTACGHQELSRSFLNAYFESTGDYDAVRVLKWYMVFRAMVRTKVATLRVLQLPLSSPERAAAMAQVRLHLELACRLTGQPNSPPTLWITHGVSGSGKTTGSEQTVQAFGALRLRADVERKRNMGADIDLYAPEMIAANYQRLAQLAELLLSAGESVIVDATFLKKAQRHVFWQLAERLELPFRILHFEAAPATLRQRIAARQRDGHDASDADATVIEQQLELQEPLDNDELALTDVPFNHT